MLARQFPLVWNEKDTYQNVYPNFPKEDYINYFGSQYWTILHLESFKIYLMELNIAPAI